MDAREVAYRRAWARIAGLMYWLVFGFDFAGMMRGGTPIGHWLSLIGGLLTIPLACGLYAAVAPVHRTIAATAFGFRLLEIALTLLSVAAAFPAIHAAWSGSPVLRLAEWNNSTGFPALVFTVGSTLFFLLFFRARLIPLAHSALGIVGSVLAFAACLAHLIRPAIPLFIMALWIPIMLGELLTGAWLLIRSVRYDLISARGTALAGAAR